MSAVLIGIDPSYSRTGIAVYYDHKIMISECRSHPSSVKTFEQVYRDARSQVRRILDTIEDIEERLGASHIERLVISECPPPQGSWSPGLYALDTLLFDSLQRIGAKVKRLYPTYLGHVHGKRKYQKSESVALARKLLQYYEHTILSKRFSHDEAEAVIFLMRNIASFGQLNPVLMKQYQVLLEEKEVEL